jgi:hypothetical protein
MMIVLNDQSFKIYLNGPMGNFLDGFSSLFEMDMLSYSKRYETDKRAIIQYKNISPCY